MAGFDPASIPQQLVEGDRQIAHALAGGMKDRIRDRRGGSTRGYVTSALVGIAGSFVGFHLAGLVKQSTGFAPFVAAAVAALMIVWWWRTLKL